MKITEKIQFLRICVAIIFNAASELAGNRF